ncbi:unnamed protein product [Amoebophrya sp. A120]|nr:unnamed protein product [Amoebophrya sp. A120]|eukprot:GSA120T00009676001.1
MMETTLNARQSLRPELRCVGDTNRARRRCYDATATGTSRSSSMVVAKRDRDCSSWGSVVSKRTTRRLLAVATLSCVSIISSHTSASSSLYFYAAALQTGAEEHQGGSFVGYGQLVNHVINNYPGALSKAEPRAAGPASGIGSIRPPPPTPAAGPFLLTHPHEQPRIAPFQLNAASSLARTSSSGGTYVTTGGTTTTTTRTPTPTPRLIPPRRNSLDTTRTPLEQGRESYHATSSSQQREVLVDHDQDETHSSAGTTPAQPLRRLPPSSALSPTLPRPPGPVVPVFPTPDRHNVVVTDDALWAVLTGPISHRPGTSAPAEMNAHQQGRHMRNSPFFSNYPSHPAGAQVTDDEAGTNDAALFGLNSSHGRQNGDTLTRLQRITGDLMQGRRGLGSSTTTDHDYNDENSTTSVVESPPALSPANVIPSSSSSTVASTRTPQAPAAPRHRDPQQRSPSSLILDTEFDPTSFRGQQDRQHRSGAGRRSRWSRLASSTRSRTNYVSPFEMFEAHLQADESDEDQHDEDIDILLEGGDDYDVILGPPAPLDDIHGDEGAPSTPPGSGTFAPVTRGGWISPPRAETRRATSSYVELHQQQPQRVLVSQQLSDAMQFLPEVGASTSERTAATTSRDADMSSSAVGHDQLRDHLLSRPGSSSDAGARTATHSTQLQQLASAPQTPPHRIIRAGVLDSPPPAPKRLPRSLRRQLTHTEDSQEARSVRTGAAASTHGMIFGVGDSQAGGGVVVENTVTTSTGRAGQLPSRSPTNLTTPSTGSTTAASPPLTPMRDQVIERGWWEWDGLQRDQIQNHLPHSSTSEVHRFYPRMLQPTPRAPPLPPSGLLADFFANNPWDAANVVAPGAGATEISRRPPSLSRAAVAQIVSQIYSRTTPGNRDSSEETESIQEETPRPPIPNQQTETTGGRAVSTTHLHNAPHHDNNADHSRAPERELLRRQPLKFEQYLATEYVGQEEWDLPVAVRNLVLQADEDAEKQFEALRGSFSRPEQTPDEKTGSTAVAVPPKSSGATLTSRRMLQDLLQAVADASGRKNRARRMMTRRSLPADVAEQAPLRPTLKVTSNAGAAEVHDSSRTTKRKREATDQEAGRADEMQHDAKRCNYGGGDADNGNGKAEITDPSAGIRTRSAFKGRPAPLANSSIALVSSDEKGLPQEEMKTKFPMESCNVCLDDIGRFRFRVLHAAGFENPEASHNLSEYFKRSKTRMKSGSVRCGGSFCPCVLKWMVTSSENSKSPTCPCCRQEGWTMQSAAKTPTEYLLEGLSSSQPTWEKGEDHAEDEEAWFSCEEPEAEACRYCSRGSSARERLAGTASGANHSSGNYELQSASSSGTAVRFDGMMNSSSAVALSSAPTSSASSGARSYAHEPAQPIAAPSARSLTFAEPVARVSRTVGTQTPPAVAAAAAASAPPRRGILRRNTDTGRDHPELGGAAAGVVTSNQRENERGHHTSRAPTPTRSSRDRSRSNPRRGGRSALSRTSSTHIDDLSRREYDPRGEYSHTSLMEEANAPGRDDVVDRNQGRFSTTTRDMADAAPIASTDLQLHPVQVQPVRRTRSGIPIGVAREAKTSGRKEMEQHARGAKRSASGTKHGGKVCRRGPVYDPETKTLTLPLLRNKKQMLAHWKVLWATRGKEMAQAVMAGRNKRQKRSGGAFVAPGPPSTSTSMQQHSIGRDSEHHRQEQDHHRRQDQEVVFDRTFPHIEELFHTSTSHQQIYAPRSGVQIVPSSTDSAPMLQRLSELEVQEVAEMNNARGGRGPPTQRSLSRLQQLTRTAADVDRELVLWEDEVVATEQPGRGGIVQEQSSFYGTPPSSSSSSSSSSGSITNFSDSTRRSYPAAATSSFSAITGGPGVEDTTTQGLLAPESISVGPPSTRPPQERPAHDQRDLQHAQSQQQQLQHLRQQQQRLRQQHPQQQQQGHAQLRQVPSPEAIRAKEQKKKDDGLLELLFQDEGFFEYVLSTAEEENFIEYRRFDLVGWDLIVEIEDLATKQVKWVSLKELLVAISHVEEKFISQLLLGFGTDCDGGRSYGGYPPESNSVYDQIYYGLHDEDLTEPEISPFPDPMAAAERHEIFISSTDAKKEQVQSLKKDVALQNGGPALEGRKHQAEVEEDVTRAASAMSEEVDESPFTLHSLKMQKNLQLYELQKRKDKMQVLKYMVLMGGKEKLEFVLEKVFHDQNFGQEIGVEEEKTEETIAEANGVQAKRDKIESWHVYDKEGKIAKRIIATLSELPNRVLEAEQDQRMNNYYSRGGAYYSGARARNARAGGPPGRARRERSGAFDTTAASASSSGAASSTSPNSAANPRINPVGTSSGSTSLVHSSSGSGRLEAQLRQERYALSREAERRLARSLRDVD